jgi:anti-sigma B factor antagonist
MADLTVHTSDCGGHAVVALSGELDMTDAAYAAAAVKEAGHRVIVDLSALEYIDCYALGALLRARELAQQAGGDVLLAAPRGPVLRVLGLTGISGTLGVFASVAAAASSVRCAIPGPAAARGQLGAADAGRPGVFQAHWMQRLTATGRREPRRTG